MPLLSGTGRKRNWYVATGFVETLLKATGSFSLSLLSLSALRLVLKLKLTLPQSFFIDTQYDHCTPSFVVGERRVCCLCVGLAVAFYLSSTC